MSLCSTQSTVTISNELTSVAVVTSNEMSAEADCSCDVMAVRVTIFSVCEELSVEEADVVLGEDSLLLPLMRCRKIVDSTESFFRFHQALTALLRRLTAMTTRQKHTTAIVSHDRQNCDGDGDVAPGGAADVVALLALSSVVPTETGSFMLIQWNENLQRN